MKKITIWLIAICQSIIQLQAQSYVWDNVSIGGGGYVTGLVIHPTVPGLMYMRTDVGGVFRWDVTNDKWISLSGWISIDDNNLFGVDGIALDKNNPDVVFASLGKYALAGSVQPAGIYKSTDKGANWTRVHDAQFGGNWAFRWVGEPMAVDPNNSNVVYCGTRLDGLLRSNSSGNSGTWNQVSSVPLGYTGDLVNPWTGSALLGNTSNPVGIRSVVIDGSSTTGGNSSNVYVAVYGTGIYRSSNGGSSFSLMAGSPDDAMSMAIAPGNILYVTTLKGVKKHDSGWSDLPVPTDVWESFSGISVDPFDPDRIYVATNNVSAWTRLYRSFNAGDSWQVVYSYAGNVTVHDNTWHSGNLSYFQAATASVVLDPHQEGRIYTTDWYQVWRCEDAWSANTNWYNDVEGHEEVVPLAICTPYTGVQLFSGHADVTGFKHPNQSVLPTKQLVTDKGECTSIDYCESNPLRMAIVTSDSWGGKNTKIFTSSDAGDNFNSVNVPAGSLNGKISIASNDPQKMVYVFGGSVPYYTTDGGTSWNASAGAPPNALSTTFIFQYDDPLISDRTAANTFYLLDRQGGRLYKSTNGGFSWFIHNSSLPTSSNYSNLAAGWGDDNNLIGVSMGTDGLWLSDSGGSTFVANSYFSNAKMFSFGKEKPDNNIPSIYVYGIHDSQWGVYRSDDYGVNWLRINDDDNYVGNSPTYMKGDRQEYGRIYIGTNGSGLFYGAISGSPPPSGSNSIIVRAKMVSGSGGKIELKINDNTVGTYTLTASYVDYVYNNAPNGANVKVYFQDNSGDAVIDYIRINGTILESEDQTTNTGVWQGGSCGGSLSDKMHCAGYIDYGNIDNGGNSIIVRAKMVSGSGGKIELKINDNTVSTYTLTASNVDYVYNGASTGGNVKVYFQDNTGDAVVDYISINGTILQSEDQTTNTGVWQGGSCGGTLSERIHCAGYIDYGNIGGGSTSLVTNHEFDNGTTGWSVWGSGASLAVVSDAAMSGANAGKVSITSNPTNSLDIGLFTGGISLVNGTTYTISFVAKAVSNKPIKLDVEDNGVWKAGFYPTITTTTATYSFDYTASSTSGLYALKFLIGANNADFWIDNMLIEVKKGSRNSLITHNEIQLNAFTIYPNPSNGKISIDFNGNRIDHAKIYDTTGKIVYTFDDITAGSEIDLSHLKSHIYFIKTSVGGEQIFKKIILIKE